MENIKKAKDKLEKINKLKEEMRTKNETEITPEEKSKNEKEIYAMEVLSKENLWVRLKNAKDYTEKKIREEDKNDWFMGDYHDIGEVEI